MNRLPPFLCLSISPLLRRCCSMGALLFSLLTCPATCSTKAGVRRLPMTGVGLLYVRIHQRPQCLATTHMCRGFLPTGCLATCFHTLFQEWEALLDMFLLQSPRLLPQQQNPQACSCTWFPEQATHLRPPLLLPQPRCPSEAWDLTWTGRAELVHAGCTGPEW